MWLECVVYVSFCRVCAFVLLRCFSCSHTVLPKEHSLGVIFFSSLSSCKCCIFLQFYLHFTTDYTCMIVYVTNNKENNLEFLAYWKYSLKVEFNIFIFFCKLIIINIIAYCLVFRWGINHSCNFICKWKHMKTQHAHLSSSRIGINSLQS